MQERSLRFLTALVWLVESTWRQFDVLMIFMIGPEMRMDFFSAINLAIYDMMKSSRSSSRRNAMLWMTLATLTESLVFLATISRMSAIFWCV